MQVSFTTLSLSLLTLLNNPAAANSLFTPPSIDLSGIVTNVNSDITMNFGNGATVPNVGGTAIDGTVIHETGTPKVVIGGTTFTASEVQINNGKTIIDGSTVAGGAAATTGSGAAGAAMTGSTHNAAPRVTAGAMGVAAVAGAMLAL